MTQTSSLTIDEAVAKLTKVRHEVTTKFARPDSTTRSFEECGAGSTSSAPLPKISKITDSRLMDYMYEMVFSTSSEMIAIDGGSVPAPFESARGLIFALPDFKPAVERVAYSEDLLTRAVTLLEGLTRCRLCGSNNTTVTPRQTLSSDEAPTLLLFCGSCHHRTNQTGE